MATRGWYPPAIDNWARSDAGDHLGPITVGVLHCTQSPPGGFRPRGNDYFGHQNYPHFTVDVQVVNGKRVFRVWQHISIFKSAKALSNDAGGVQTNREGVIQIEVVGYAHKPFTDDPVLVAGLAALMRWVESQTQIPRSSGVTFWAGRYGENVPHRMSYAAWQKYAGWCGHQHVPENEHYDPGAIDIRKLLALPAPIITPAPTQVPLPIPLEEDDVLYLVVDGRHPTNRPQYITDTLTKRWVQNNAERSELIALHGDRLLQREMSGAVLDAIPLVGQAPPAVTS